MNDTLTPAEVEQLSGIKCHVMTNTGDLLWRSRAWTDGRKSHAEERVKGKGWMEFVFPADCAGILAWLKDGRESVIEFCCIAPSTGRYAKVRWWKTEHRGNNLIFGDVVGCSCADGRCKRHELPEIPSAID